MKKPTLPLAELSDEAFSQQMARAVRALPDVPLALERAALSLFPAQSATVSLLASAQTFAQTVVQTVVGQVQAVLSFDSWAAPALASGMRSLRSPTRHLLFTAQGRDCDLRIAPQSPAAEVYTMTGQILGPDLGGHVELQADGDAATPSRQATLDDLGEFRLEGLTRGVYRVTLHLGGEQIVLPPVEVGEAAGEPAR